MAANSRSISLKMTASNGALPSSILALCRTNGTADSEMISTINRVHSEST